MFCVICGCVSDTKTCSTKCRVSLHRMNVKSSDGVGYLYTVKFDGVVKFGSSKDPVIRLRQIELSSGRVGGVLSVFGPFVGVGKVEAKIHKLMSLARICGEWYDGSAEHKILELINMEEPLDSEGVFSAISVQDLNNAIEKAISDASELYSNGGMSNFGDINFFGANSFLKVVDSSMNAVLLARGVRATNAVESSLSSILGIPNEMLGISKLDDELIKSLIMASFIIAYCGENSDLIYDDLKEKLGSHAASWASSCAGYISKMYNLS